MGLRVVFDTNIVVSAALDTRERLLPQGRPSLCLMLGIGGVVEMVVSDVLLAEYEAVLLRPRFGFPQRQARAFVALLRSRGKLVHQAPISSRAGVAVEDAHVLGTAVAGQAAFLVTGNRLHFPESYRGTRVVSPADFLAAFGTLFRGGR